MSSDPEGITDRRLDRKTLLKLGAAAGAGGLLAGCGASADSGGDAGGETGGDGGEEVQRPPIEQEPGTLQVFEWAGYEIPELYSPYVKSDYKKPKFSFLTSDAQALSKVRAGFTPDIVHNCVDFTQDWVNAELVQPWDPELISNFGDLNPEMVKAGQIDGQQYFIPLDWGFSAPLYRADKVDPMEDSWNIFFDERYAGKISWWDDFENFIVANAIQGAEDPYALDQADGDALKQILIDNKHVVRNFWDSQTSMENDFAAGNIWITYSWPDSWLNMKGNGLDVEYMDPKEGRMSWICGFVLLKDAQNYHHAHEFVDAWAAKESAEYIISEYAYGHSNTAVDLDKLPKKTVEAFNLDDPSSLEQANIAHYVEDRQFWQRLWDEVKAS